MILRRSRFVLVAGLVVFAAFLFGFGNLLTGAQPASRPRTTPPPGSAQRSGDDDGFSVTLTEPSESYLVGIKRIVIEPAVPPGDSIVGVDFFVDGRLVATDRRPPYATEIDFGQEIRRHTIIVTALTAGGRRAKVSFVSRAANLAGDAPEPIALVPAVVRDAGGRFVDGLSVGDFVLLENGARQPIVHIDDDPVPQSIAVALHAAASEEAREAFLRGAASFTESLLSFDSLGLVAVGDLSAGPGPARPAAPRAESKRKDGPEEAAADSLPALEFSFDHALFAQRLADLDGAESRRGDAPLSEALQFAIRGLLTRPRGRVLLVLLAGSGPRDTPAAAPEADGAAGNGAPDPPLAPGPEGSGADAPAAAGREELLAALDALKRSGATLHVVVYGGAEDFPFPVIHKVAEETGGAFMVAASAQAVTAACRQISESLQHQYLVSFSPSSPEREGWRSIELRLRPPDLLVQARKTYFASQPPKRP